MRSPFLPAFERAARYALHRRGFESRTVTTRLTTLHSYEAEGFGELPTTVVLHGIGSGATAFGAMLARLRPHVRRLVAPDLPGHGFSGCPADQVTPRALFDSVRTAIDEIVDEPMVLVGNSLGGVLGIRYAVEHPDRVRALVLASPAGARIDEEEWRSLIRAFRIESAAEARRLLGRLYHRTPWYMPAVAPGFRDVMKRRPVRDILDTATLDDLLSPEMLRGLSMPLLLLWGESERIFPPSALAYFRQHLPPHALVEEPAGFGHCPHFDDPGRLATRVVDFARNAVDRGPPVRS